MHQRLHLQRQEAGVRECCSAAAARAIANKAYQLEGESRARMQAKYVPGLKFTIFFGVINRGGIGCVCAILEHSPMV